MNKNNNEVQRIKYSHKVAVLNTYTAILNFIIAIITLFTLI